MSQPAQNTALVKKEAAAYLADPKIVSAVKPVLPKHITAERFMRIVQTTVMRNEKLLDAANHPLGKLSLMDAILRCAQAGLEPDGRLAHFVPFWNSEKGTYEVSVIFDWKGLVTLGIRNGFDSVYPDMVCENDQFDAWVENGEKRILHRVDYRKARGKPYAFYNVTMKSRILDYEIMTWQECEDIRKRSRYGDKGPWVTDTNEMMKKCPIRRMAKRWDLLPEIRDIIWNDDDTPPPLDQPKEPSKPLFVNPEPKAIEAQPTEPEPENPERKLRLSLLERLNKASLSEVDLMAFLTGTGIVPEGTLYQDCEFNILKMVDMQFDDMVKKFKSTGAA